MNSIDAFEKRNREKIAEMGQDQNLKKVTKDWFVAASEHEYSYHFKWLGRPVIQFPGDIVAMQEIIWKTRPDLIIECGVAHGGSLILSASILELLQIEGKVLGIDIDIREHNRVEIENHPLSKRIQLIEGSSTSDEVIDMVKKEAAKCKSVMVILDSNHTHDHVSGELAAYAELVSVGNYLIVFDTVIEDISDHFTWNGRDWGKGDNPKTAVWEFLKKNDSFKIDEEIHNKLLITVAPDGYLHRVK